MSEPRHLFVYGSLLFEPVVRAVAGAALDSCPATLDGYRRYGVAGARYPAIAAQPGATVQGRVLRDVPAGAMARLDAYEDVGGGLYEKQRVMVRTEGGTRLTAWAYVAGPRLAARLCGEWDPDAFDIDAYFAAPDGPYQTWRRRGTQQT